MMNINDVEPLYPKAKIIWWSTKESNLAGLGGRFTVYPTSIVV